MTTAPNIQSHNKISKVASLPGEKQAENSVNVHFLSHLFWLLKFSLMGTYGAPFKC